MAKVPRAKEPQLKFWISRTFYTRRLHRIGGCPSSDSAINVELVDNIRTADYNATCKKCFRWETVPEGPMPNPQAPRKPRGGRYFPPQKELRIITTISDSNLADWGGI